MTTVLKALLFVEIDNITMTLYVSLRPTGAGTNQIDLPTCIMMTYFIVAMCR